LLLNGLMSDMFPVCQDRLVVSVSWDRSLHVYDEVCSWTWCGTRS
jgi:hypothetical protein